MWRLSLIVVLGIVSFASQAMPESHGGFGASQAGMSSWRRTFQHEDKSFSAAVIAADPKRAVRILGAASLGEQANAVGRSTYAPGGLLLEDFLRLSGATAAISGGYLSSFSPPRPLGYLQVGEKVESGRHESWLVDGVVCTKGGKPSILESKVVTWKNLASEYDGCVQAGPLIIAHGEVLFPRSGDARPGPLRLARSTQEQAFVCIDDRGWFVMAVTSPIVAAAATDLAARSRDSGGLGCRDALRLSGGKTAGLVRGDAREGRLETLLPDAIAVE